MERNTLEALADFSAGCFFASLLSACAILYGVHKRSRLHKLTTWLFGWLATMNMVLFILFYIKNFLGDYLLPITNLYQATCIPMCVCLLYELARPGRLTRKTLFLHISPFFVALLLYACTLNPSVYYLSIDAALCYGFAGLLWASLALRRYNHNIRRWSSYTEGINANWVFYILGALLALYAVWIIASYMGVQWANALYNFSCCAIFLSIALCLRRHEVVVPNQTISSVTEIVNCEENEKYEECSQKKREQIKNYHFTEELQKAFEQDKIFLEPKLTITMLAEKLNTNRTYLSNYINNELNVSFFEYVNRYRIKYAKQLLTSNEYTIEAISTMCGYNSLSAFRRTFTSITGTTPGQYRKEQTEQNASQLSESCAQQEVHSAK